jgi:hypothetical protein
VRSGFTEISFSMASTLRSTKMTLDISIVAPCSPAAVAAEAIGRWPHPNLSKSILLCFHDAPLAIQGSSGARDWVARHGYRDATLLGPY